MACLQISVSNDIVVGSGQYNAVQFIKPKCNLQNDLGNLFKLQTLSDVTLSVGGEEYRVHKNILAGK